MKLGSLLWHTLLALMATITSSHQIRCISVYGMETDWRNTVCSWKNDMTYYMDYVKGLGFNSLRMPFSYQYVMEGDFTVMDRFVDEAAKRDLWVIADLHRIWNGGQSPTPFDGINMDQFVSCWKTVAWRYKDHPALKAMNSYNEYQLHDPETIVAYSSKLFTEIEAMLPGRYHYFVTGTFWAGNLTGVNLEHLPFADRISYSVHKYAWSGTADEADWNSSIPFDIPNEKLIIGEWGWMEDKPHEVEWAKRFIAYLKRRGIEHTCFWTTAHSHDTGNLWEDDCEIIKWDNYNLLKTLWVDDRRHYLRT